MKFKSLSPLLCAAQMEETIDSYIGSVGYSSAKIYQPPGESIALRRAQSESVVASK